MLERFFKRRHSEITFLNSYIEFLKAEIREKDKTIAYLKETINKDLNEYNLINILVSLSSINLPKNLHLLLGDAFFR